MELLDPAEKTFINQAKYVISENFRSLLKVGKEIPDFKKIGNLKEWIKKKAQPF